MGAHGEKSHQSRRSLAGSYQRLQKQYPLPPCLALSVQGWNWKVRSPNDSRARHHWCAPSLSDDDVSIAEVKFLILCDVTIPETLTLTANLSIAVCGTLRARQTKLL